MKFNISNNIICVILLLAATVFYNCKTEDKGTVLADKMTQQDTLTSISGVEEADSSGFVITEETKTISNTSPKEKDFDDSIVVIILEDLNKSKYSDCNEIIIDYMSIIKQLENGNRKPLSEFPEKEDPTIKLCKNTNPLFVSKLDSLKAVAKNILVDNYLKSFN